MAVFDTAEANRLLNASFGQAAFTAPTAPMKMRLCSAVGSDAAAGTEISGGSYPAGGLAIPFATAASARQIANSGAVSYTGMPAVTVTAVDITDSAGTPRRVAYGSLASSKTTAAGDTLSFAVSSVTIAYG